jgi:hypothetical protein
LIVSPDGSNAGIVALDKTTGAEIWRTKELSDQTGYSSCIIAKWAACAATSIDLIS